MSGNRLESNRLCSSVNVIFRTSFLSSFWALSYLALNLSFEMQVSCSLYEDVLAPLGVSLYPGLNLTFSLICMLLNYTSKLLKINELCKFSKNYFVT